MNAQLSIKETFVDRRGMSQFDTVSTHSQFDSLKELIDNAKSIKLESGQFIAITFNGDSIIPLETLTAINVDLATIGLELKLRKDYFYSTSKLRPTLSVLGY